MLVYTCFHVFSPFSAHFYPPLHHNGKGSIVHVGGSGGMQQRVHLSKKYITVVFLGGGGSGGGKAQGGHLYEMGDLMCNLAEHLMCVIITHTPTAIRSSIVVLHCQLLVARLCSLCMEFVVFILLHLHYHYSVTTVLIS